MTRRRDPFAERGARRPAAAPATEDAPAPVPLDSLASCVFVLAAGQKARDRAAGCLAVELAGAAPVLALGEVPGATHRLDAPHGALGALLDRLDPVHVVLPEDGAALSDLGRREAVARGWPVAVRVLARDGVNALSATNLPDREAVIPAPRLWLVDPRFRGSPPPERRPVPVEATRLAPEDDPPGVRFLGLQAPDPATLALPDARFVAAAGAGVADLDLFARFARALGATPGASRVLVDAGRMPRDRQVGASGETTAAELYLAVGISGAVQHLEGIAACRHVISVNTDPGCPMAARADLSLVGDAAAVMQAVLRRLEGEP